MSGRATIGTPALAVPEHVLGQDAVKRAVAEVVPLSRERREAVLSLFDGAGVERRHSVLPVEALHQRRDLTETMDLYRTHAIRLGRKVAVECLETKDGLTVWEDHFYPEIIDPVSGAPQPDGTRGEILFTSLTKQALPLIR